MEAVYTESRVRLARLAKAPSPTIVRVEKIAVPDRDEPTPRAVTGEADPGTEPRKGSGSADPAIGSKPDAGSLDGYNRNTTNPKADSEEDRAQLRKSLKEQSTPTVLDKRRQVDKPAKDSGETVIRESRPIETWVPIQQKISAQRLNSARLALAAKEGAEFDECYLRIQVAAHQEMIDADKIYATYVSSEGRKAMEQDIERSMEYLQEAMAFLKSGSRLL